VQTPAGRGTPYRSSEPAAGFHHNRWSCPIGEMIETADRRFGTGGLPLCELCETVLSDAPIERRVSDRRAADR